MDYLNPIITAQANELADNFKSLFASSLVLRVKVHIALAKLNGAENEDLPKVIQTAIASGCDEFLRALDKMSEREKANDIET